VRTLLAVFVATLSLLIGALPAGATGGGGSSAYRADVSPGGAAAGRSSTLAVTIKQLSSSSDKKVKSARVSAPSGISIDSASAKKNGTSVPSSNIVVGSGSVTLNNIPLNANDKVVVTLTVSIPCGEGGSRTWDVVGKNGTSFATGGSPLSQDPASQLGTSIARCSLAFVAQPASAGRDKVITSEIAKPGGEPIKVRLRDGAGDPASQSGVTVELSLVSGTGAASATLGGDTSEATNSNGVASFAPTIDVSERGYKLKATASGIEGTGPSGPFDINDVAKVCSGECSGSSERGATAATISSSSNGGVLTMSLGLDELSCDNAANQFYKSTSAPVTWDITPANDRTFITIRLDASEVTRPYNLYDVCFSSPVSSFRNRYNVRIGPGEAGLLKGCPERLGKQDADPCVHDKWREDGDVLIKFSVPAGDPRGRI
jgi:hypothetical protein